jgi:hypothetical protein
MRGMTRNAQTSEDLISLIWPNGMTDREQIVFNGLLPSKREVVLKRLEAVWRAENGEPWEPLAASIGLGRAAFYNLRKAWREQSIEGVIPYERRAARSLETPEDAPIRRLARNILRSADLASGNSLTARRLLNEAGDDATIGGATQQTRLQWAERLIRHERRRLALDPQFLQKNFAKRIILDLTAIPIVIEGDEELAVVAIVMDTASGLILGDCFGTIDDAAELQLVATRIALAFVEDMRPGLSYDYTGYPDLDLILPPSRDAINPPASLLAASRSLEIRAPGTYAYGQQIVQTVGPKIGRIPLAPRKTLSVQREKFARSRKVADLDPIEASAFWQREALRHNEPILLALEKAGLLRADRPNENLEALLFALAEFLASLPDI